MTGTLQFVLIYIVLFDFDLWIKCVIQGELSFLAQNNNYYKDTNSIILRHAIKWDDNKNYKIFQWPCESHVFGVCVLTKLKHLRERKKCVFNLWLLCDSSNPPPKNNFKYSLIQEIVLTVTRIEVESLKSRIKSKSYLATKAHKKTLPTNYYYIFL